MIELCAVGAPEPDVGGMFPPSFLEIKRALCNSEERNLITMTYFLFTTLSTTGFGDYHPRSNIERVACALLLLFGLLVFAYILGEYGSILDDIKNLDADVEEGDALTRFFGMIKWFNDN